MSTDPLHQPASIPALNPLAAPGLPEVAPAAEGGEVYAVASGWRLALREFADNRLALAAAGVLVFFVLFCFLGPLFYHSNQTITNPLATDQAPSSAHILGTDDNSFDELGRIMLGGQTALEIGFLAAALATVISTLWGATAGLLGGLIDGLMMRFVDILLSIPYLLIVLVLATKYHATVLDLALIIAIPFAWLVPARLVRGEVLTLREREFVQAATVMGASRSRIVLRHLIPNALSVVIVNITFQVADAILLLAYLGFLGFGLPYPAASWGDMLGNAQQYVASGYWWLVYPVGGCLVLLVLACNLVGDALRDALDVRLRRR